ncbi:MAG: FUSC family protein, partial [Candidatus Dormibacteraeota bacterium]|nr:FUSC family protein [Candidatus Dormibacteraeota bacterium]
MPVVMGLTLLQLRSRARSLAWGLAKPPRILPPLVVQCIKVALACGVVWWLGPLLHMPQPFNAALAVIILMQGHAYGSLLNALEFLLGVAAGLLLGIGVHLVFGVSPLTLAGIMFVALLMGGWLKVSSQNFNNQIAISALLVLASGSADNVNRLWETVLGGAVGVMVAAFLWPPNPLGQLRGDYRALKGHLESDILRSLELAGVEERAQEAESNRRSAREHSERADAAVAAVAPAQQALRWSPWFAGGLQDLSRLEDRLRLISYLYRTVRALARQAAKTAVNTAAVDDPGAVESWRAARPALLAAGSDLVLAVQRRLVGEDARDAVGRAREEVDHFAAALTLDHQAGALA